MKKYSTLISGSTNSKEKFIKDYMKLQNWNKKQAKYKTWQIADALKEKFPGEKDPFYEFYVSTVLDEM